MNKNVGQVLRGYLNLTPEEQKEFNDFLRDLQLKKFSFVDGKKRIAEAIDLGPMNSACRCCGR